MSGHSVNITYLIKDKGGRRKVSGVRLQYKDFICSTYISIRGEGGSAKLNVLTCSKDVGEESVEWEIPLVDVAEGAAAVWDGVRECGRMGERECV